MCTMCTMCTVCIATTDNKTAPYMGAVVVM